MDNPRIINFTEARAERKHPTTNEAANHNPGLQQIWQGTVNDHQMIAEAKVFFLLLTEQLERYRKDIANTQAFCQACQQACELGDLAAMERERDRLAAEIRTRSWYSPTHELAPKL